MYKRQSKDTLKLLPSSARTKDGFKRLLENNKRLLRDQGPGAPGLRQVDPDVDVPDPVADPDAGAPVDPGAQGGAGQPNSQPDSGQPGNIIERLIPGFRGRAGSGK